MSDELPSILRDELERRVRSIDNFRRDQEAVWTCIDLLLITSLTAIRNAPRCPGIDLRATTIIMLWHTLWDYQVDSVLLALSNKLDQAYAALRMAAELARDCARIGESERNFRLWRSRRDKHATDEYKDIFRFSKADLFETKVYQLYNLASFFGVHGHQTTESYLEVCQHMPEHGVVVLKPSEMAPYDVIKVWLRACLSLHMCCLQALPQEVRVYLAREIKGFQSAFGAVDNVVTQFIAPAIGRAKAQEHDQRKRS